MTTAGQGVLRRATIDLAVVRSTVASLSASLSGVTADLRADAYGHGLLPVARAVSDAGVSSFLVSRGEGVATLTNAGIDGLVSTAAPAEGTLLGPELFGLDAAVLAPPALRLEAEAIAVKRVAAHRGVSYGYTYRTPRPTTLVLVALGYSDGILRIASNKAPVQVGTTRGRVTGRIAMDQFVIDIGDGQAVPGDEVVLFGDPADGEPGVLDWADALGVAAPVITSRLGSRIERVHTA